MSARYLHQLWQQWLLLLTLALSAGLGAQCVSQPAFGSTPAEVSTACSAFAAVNLNNLPPNISRCYFTNASTGEVIPTRLSGALNAALRGGGDLPIATSTCGTAVEVCVSDQVQAGNECGTETTITRRFVARNDEPTASNDSTVFQQTIRFIRPALADLQPVAEAIFVVADNGQGMTANPAPRPEDHPQFSIDGNDYPVSEVCGFSITYQDGERRNGCGNNFRFIRTFRTEDLCTRVSALFTQVVKVGDQQERLITPPVITESPLVFYTTEGCGARINTRATGITINDICNGGGGGLNAFVYLNGNFEFTPRGPYRVDNNNRADAITDPLPAGEHVIRYVGQDSYGTTTTLDIDILIEDATPPVARCRASLTAILRADGTRRIASQLFDGGSTDACGGIRVSAARADENGRATEAFSEEMIFTCAEIGTRDVVVNVTDDKGNHDQCLITVIVEDNSVPECQAPAAVSLDCRTFADQLPANLTEVFTANPDSMSVQLDNVFGAAAGADNCGQSNTSQSLSGNLSNCGTGRFVREFTVTDGGGFTVAEPCQQFIDVRPYIAYSILMPADQRYTCAELPTPDDLVAGDTGCDLLTATTEVDTLPDNGIDCYRLRLRHEVTNWCEYDGVSAGLTIPRDADGDGFAGERVGVHILARSSFSLTDDVAQLDQDFQPGNGNELGLLVRNYATSGLRGRFHYTQFISLTDNTAPTVTIPAGQTGQAFTETCLGGIALTFTATDDCVTPTISVSVDTEGGDRNGDGVLTAADFTEDRLVPAGQFRTLDDGMTEVRIRNLSIGEHLARIRVTDDCGNLEESYTLLNIVDNRAPTPVCREANRVNLATDPNLGGVAVVQATDVIVGTPASCTQTDFRYSIFRESEAAATDFVPSADHRNTQFDCSDLGEQVLRVYAFVASTGRNDFCRVVITITDPDEVCAGRQGSISGIVLTEDGQVMKDLETYLTPDNGALQQVTRTDDIGIYAFDALLEGEGYAVQPYRNDEANNGVETFDISQIFSLINNQNYEDFTPYQIIAADANNSGTITVVDLLAVRSVVLGITSEFENNTSWRFISADYIFPNPENPWAERFPEKVSVDNLSGAVSGDFVAIKVGDLNNTARANGRGGLLGGLTTEGRRSEAMVLVETGTPGEWELRLANPVNDAGLQFELVLSDGTQLLSAESETLGYVYTRESSLLVISLATNGEILRVQVPKGEVLPTLAATPDFPALLFGTDDAVTALTLGPPIVATAKVQPATVSPNPITATSSVRFISETEEVVEVSLLSAAGRVLNIQRVQAVRGENRVAIAGAGSLVAGVYFVRVSWGDKVEVVTVVVR